jgi:pimeloyl-ACP methyl ester carboxylesterase
VAQPSYTLSADGSLIAYQQTGNGPAILLLHGGGGSRRDWQEAGYTAILQEHFTVVAMGLRGHGESYLPTDPATLFHCQTKFPMSKARR